MDPSEPLHLRDAGDDDYAVLFAYLQDAPSRHLAAFGTLDGTVEDFAARSRRGQASGYVFKVIVEGSRVVGYVGRFSRDGKPEVTYWVARDRWSHGIATRALALLIAETSERPLHASAASDNVGSLRVLAKCGFVVTRTEQAFADGRGQDVTEVFLELR